MKSEEQLRKEVVGEKSLDELARVVDRLAALLRDPQPGISQWCLMYGESMNYIASHWKGTDLEQSPSEADADPNRTEHDNKGDN